MQVLFKVIRQQQNTAQSLQTYILDVQPEATVLECLNRIKWELDGSLACKQKLSQYDLR